METLRYAFDSRPPAPGSGGLAIAGVVASGNLEVMLERSGPDDCCIVEIATPVAGFAAVWEAVVADFVAQHATGGLRISVNDGGARPDTVALRLAQGLRMIAAETA